MIQSDLPAALSQILIEEWIKAFKKRPKLVAISTVCTIIAGVAISIFVNHEISKKQKILESKADLNLYSQLQALDHVQTSLRNLNIFIEEQRRKITIEQELIAKLSTERSQLEPIVQQQRSVIEQILTLQAQKQAAEAERAKWIERGFGFFGGIISSIIASFLYAIFIRFRKKIPPNTSVEDPA